jgi:carbon-monoxide dehydrogenase medium subunit|tara:strand:- start:3305 stop:4183 length:879 start_codon:yes stop_codon:yes gene_type:complete
LKPASFYYLKPASLDEAVEMLAEHGDDARVLAGGQSLVPLLNMRLARPAVLIDINGLPDLDQIDETGGKLVVGALCRQSRLSCDPLIDARLPLLAATAALMSHPQIRNRGTIVGSIAHGDPSAELPAVALLLDAKLRVRGRHRERLLDIGEFYQGYFATTLAPGELVIEVLLPVPTSATGWSIHEISRRHGDFALAGVTCLMTVSGATIERCRLAGFGVAGSAIRFPHLEARLEGEPPSPELFRLVSADIGAYLTPTSDPHASAEYRKALAVELCHRALQEAWARSRPDSTG